MTIDDQHGLPPLAEALRVPTHIFPKAVQEKLVKALLELPQLWRGMSFDAFRRGGVVYLRVALDVADRPLYLFVHEDGRSFQFESPIFLAFPESASHFVLSELCGRNTYLSFRLDRHKHLAVQDAGTSAGDGQVIQTAAATREVLYAWGRFEFDTFVEEAASLVPYIITNLLGAELEHRYEGVINGVDVSVISGAMLRNGTRVRVIPQVLQPPAD